MKVKYRIHDQKKKSFPTHIIRTKESLNITMTAQNLFAYFALERREKKIMYLKLERNIDVTFCLFEKD